MYMKFCFCINALFNKITKTKQYKIPFLNVTPYLLTSCFRRYRLPRGSQCHGRAEEEQEEAAGLPRQLRRAGHIQRAAGGPRAGVSAVQQLELVQKAISNIYI